MATKTSGRKSFVVTYDLLSIIYAFLDGTVEINTRIAKAYNAMIALKSLWGNRGISLSVKKRVYLASVRSVLLYACESWPVKAEHERRLDAFDHRMMRWILHVSYLDRVTNAEIRRRFNETETISTSIKRRRLKWFGHVARMEHTRLPYLSVFHPIPKWRGLGSTISRRKKYVASKTF